MINIIYFGVHTSVITGGISFPNGAYVNTCFCRDQQWMWVLAGAAKAGKSKRRVNPLSIVTTVITTGNFDTTWMIIPR